MKEEKKKLITPPFLPGIPFVSKLLNATKRIERFGGTEASILTIAEATGCYQAPALEGVKDTLVRAFHRVSLRHSGRGYQKGATLAVRKDTSFIFRPAEALEVFNGGRRTHMKSVSRWKGVFVAARTYLLPAEGSSRGRVDSRFRS